jgi:hypothetical protein
MFRPRSSGVVLRFLLNSRFVLFFRLFESGVFLFLVIAPDGLSCCIFYGRLFIPLSSFFVLEVALYDISVVEFLFLLFFLALSPFDLRYRLGFVEISG